MLTYRITVECHTGTYDVDVCWIDDEDRQGSVVWYLEPQACYLPDTDIEVCPEYVGIADLLDDEAHLEDRFRETYGLEW